MEREEEAQRTDSLQRLLLQKHVQVCFWGRWGWGPTGGGSKTSSIGTSSIETPNTQTSSTLGHLTPGTSSTQTSSTLGHPAPGTSSTPDIQHPGGLLINLLVLLQKYVQEHFMNLSALQNGTFICWKCIFTSFLLVVWLDYFKFKCIFTNLNS